MSDVPIQPAANRRHRAGRDAIAGAPLSSSTSSSSSPSRTAEARTVRWIYVFIGFEIVCQLLLLFPPLAPARVALRIGAFALSLSYLFLLPPRTGSRYHPAIGCLLASIAMLLLAMLNPQAGTMLARLATIAEYIAIAGPILWVSGLHLTFEDLHRIVLVMWAFAALSAITGALQTLRPDWKFLQPNLSSVVQNFEDGGEGLKLALANGAMVFRPMGLTDQPGGAATAGMTTILFGMALLVRHRNPWMWILVLSTMVLGLFCIYVSLVRSLLVMSGVCVIALVACFALNREYHRIARPLGALLAVIAAGTALALIVGGESITDRLTTLVADDPSAVYYQNRGHFLEETFLRTIPTYPLGAGPGRWGMVNYYFGHDDPREPLWAEIQWTAWVYDGGVPLMAAYAFAALAAIFSAWRFTRYRASADARLWASVIFAYNVGALAVTFNYPFFMSQAGMDFWLLNAALFAAVTTDANARRRRRAIAVPGGATASPDRAPLPTSILGMHG